MKTLLICLEHEGRVLHEGESGKLELPIQIGRSSECAWSVAGIDSTMSGKHAELYRKRGSVWIKDLGSRNGITCTEGRITEKKLRGGDKLHLGGCVLTVEEVSDRRKDGAPGFNQLEQLNGPRAGTVFELKEVGEVKIGSGAADGIMCLDPLVSREHAVLLVKADGSCWVRDLGSRNGTSVNGTPLAKGKERLLRDGDILSIAYIEFRFIDGSVVHPKAQVIRKVLLALATVAVALIGYYTYATIRPSSKMLLAKAVKYAEMERFEEAAATAKASAEARGADATVRDRQEMLANIERWRRTAEGWVKVRAAIAARDWSGAQVHSVELVAWDWNSGGAPMEGVRAERALRLVLALRDAQRVLAMSEGMEALAQAGRDLSSAREALLDPAIVSGGMSFADALLSDTDRVLPELAATMQDLKEINETVLGLKPGGAGRLPDGAARITDAVDALVARNKARNAALGDGRAAPFSPSHVVENRADELRAPLKHLTDSEETFAKNVFAIASGGDGISATLPLPPPALAGICDSFPKYASWLERQNEVLCTQVAAGWKARIGELAKIGMEPGGAGRPKILAALFSDAVMDKALKFVPSTTVRIEKIVDGEPNGDSPVYHIFIGMFDFIDFLEALEPDRMPTRAIAGYGKISDNWESAIEETRRVCHALRSFRDYGDRTGGEVGTLARLVAKAKQEKGKSNAVAELLENVEGLLREIDNWAEATFPAKCAREGSKRAEILALGVKMLLAENPSRDNATALADRWAAFKRTIPKWDGEESTAQKIFDMALPGMPAHQKAWAYLQRMAQ